MSNDRYNLDGSDLLVAGISSNPLTRPFIVPLDTPQLEEGQMRRPSVVRADKIFSIDHAIVLRCFGRMNRDTFELVRRAILSLLAEAG